MKKELKFLLLVALLSQSCNQFLDVKPDKKLAVLSTTKSAQTILNNSRTFNLGHPSEMVIASDELYVGYNDWAASMTLAERNSYIWHKDVFDDNDRNPWSLSYVAIYHCNVILDALKNDEIQYNNINELHDIKGQALFYRAYSFYNLLQIFSKPWSSDAEKDLGIALRLTSDLNMQSVRSTVKESYEQIIKDVEEAYTLLNSSSGISTRPNKTAALAFLARIYLSIEDYSAALNYADNALALKSDLLNLNEIDLSKPNPFERFNNEVIFHATLGAPLILYPHITRVDSVIYGLFDDNDLQKNAFFQHNSDGSSSFKGSFDNSPVLFSGLTTAELYYIKAECMARLSQFDQALLTLSELLVTRWRKEEGQTTYITPVLHGEDDVLSYVLKERKKGLLFRGTGWTDLRRLNKDPRFAKVIKRNLKGEEYTLEPSQQGYVFQIPLVVINMTGMQQN